MPIVCGREPTSSEEEKRVGSERSAELSAKVNQVTIFFNFIPLTMIFMSA